MDQSRVPLRTGLGYATDDGPASGKTGKRNPVGAVS
jgi:hypothetical protein